MTNPTSRREFLGVDGRCGGDELGRRKSLCSRRLGRARPKRHHPSGRDWLWRPVPGDAAAIHETARCAGHGRLRRALRAHERDSAGGRRRKGPRLSRFPQAAGGQGRRRRHRGHQRPLARALHHPRLPGRQRCVRGEAGEQFHRRGAVRHRGRAKIRPHRADRHPAAQPRALSEGRGDHPVGPAWARSRK